MTKRRGKGEGTLYQRPDGTWRAMIDLGWSGGRRIRRSVSGATRREVVDKLGTPGAQWMPDSGRQVTGSP
jgi:hypothetical protein